MSGNNDQSCQSIHMLISRELDGIQLSESQSQALREHLGTCESCQQWHFQHKALIEQASVMPQFDVSEALTQRILQAVDKTENPALAKALQTTAMALAAIVLLVVSSFDNPMGWLSWAIGLVSMQGLKMLIEKPYPRRPSYE